MREFDAHHVMALVVFWHSRFIDWVYCSTTSSVRSSSISLPLIHKLVEPSCSCLTFLTKSPNNARTTMSSLDAQAEERKKRLAQLKSLKRKQDAEAEDTSYKPSESTIDETAERGVKLSGRNFDVEERAPKMGFTHAPNDGQETIEAKAQEIVEYVRAQQADDEAAEKPIDLFNLQPKKPNWDLKRDVGKKLERLKPRTKSAIAKLVRERIDSVKVGQDGGEDQAVNSAMEGKLAELVKEREKEVDEDDGDIA